MDIIIFRERQVSRFSDRIDSELYLLVISGCCENIGLL